jgi:hypothetical protein
MAELSLDANMIALLHILKVNGKFFYGYYGKRNLGKSDSKRKHPVSSY